MSPNAPRRVIVFGASGHLGREILARIDELGDGNFELVGVVSEGSTATEFEWRGEWLDATTSPPTFRAEDLVFVCTPVAVASDIVRTALLAQVPCIDCTGVMAQQPEVSMPVLSADFVAAESSAGSTPLLALPSATTLAWAPLLEALGHEGSVERLVGTVLKSASALGRRGLVALSEESIALFNQSEAPDRGPAGQDVAFDVLPAHADEARVPDELARLFGAAFRVDVMGVHVPTFVGEGASLSIEFASPVDEAALRKRLTGLPGYAVVEGGHGTRGLAAVEPGLREPTGPTLRDAADAEEVLMGELRADPSLPAGIGWRLWLSYDPLRVAAHHAIRLAELRFATP